MSGNQKQSAAGGPQTQRYSSSPAQKSSYSDNAVGYVQVKRENDLCIVHGKITPEHRVRNKGYSVEAIIDVKKEFVIACECKDCAASEGSDGFSVSAPAGSYVPQTQGPNQGPGLRGIPPTGPPNQSSTPPNADIKVQNLPGQIASMPFVQTQVRAPTQYFQNRGAAGPPSQTPRMPNQHRPQAPPQLYSSTQYVMPSLHYLQPNMYYNPAQRPPSNIMAAQTYAPQVYPQQLAYPTYPQQQSSGVPTYAPVAYYSQQPAAMMTRPPVAPAIAAPNTAPGTMQAAPLIQPPGQSHGNYQRNNNKQRRPKAISIIDPTTGEDKLNEIFDENNSHPASGESSARQTPQPAPLNPNKEVQAAFAKQVAQAINEDRQHNPANDQPPLLHEPSPPEHFQLAAPQPAQPVSTVHLIQNSNLHYNAKEFVSSVAKPTKDSTPIVSANSDAAEVILPKKDRESPVKGRKQGQRDPKVEPPKESLTKEAECDRSSLVVKEEINPVPQTAPVATTVSDQTPVPELAPPIKEIVKEILDKKGVKKPTQAEPKSPEPIENIAQVSADVASSNNGKSKNSQKSKQLSNQNGKAPQPQPQPQQVPQSQQQPQQQHQQSQPQPQPQLQPQPPLPIPVSQPPKANNRSNKSKELNMRGANKEGTDMDAFNDNISKTEINANIFKDDECNKVSSNDIVNANPVLQSEAPPIIPSTIEPEPVINSQNISDTKQIDSNENVTTINSEHIINTAPVLSAAAPIILKPASKPFDVTSIIKDTPKTVLSFTQNDNKDETDRAVPQTDIVLAKNDVNSKVAVENALNDVKSQLPYKPGQWAPDRPEGKKQYERDFLLALKNHPASRQKPDNIPDNVLQDERNRQMDGRLSMGGRTDFTNPPFTSYGPKSGSQRGPVPKRNSQTGKMGSRGGDNKGSNKPLPKVSISLRGDVKLHESENAWKPTRFQKGESNADDDKKTDSLYKRVRSVLNKLTPQKFDTLVNQVRQLQIDTKDRLQGVIDLVFDKAIDEPSFSVAYAKMCKELQIMQVNAGTAGEDKKIVAFRTLLVTRCQQEFEKQSVDETERNRKVKIINECTDTEKKKELSFELEEYDRRLRMKSVGCIRFIGELFKQQMLTTSIMLRCLQTLIDNKDEESLECLCKLLTTVGKELETKNNLSGIFDEMKRIIDGKKQKVSSRIRFMLQDVTELRDSKWIPRRNDANPKTMDQIQKEAETEHLNIQVMNMNTPRKDDRGMGPRGGGGQRQKPSDDGWNSVGSRNNRQQQQFSIQTDKMRAAKLPLVDEPLGSSQLFGNWGKGAGGSKNVQPPVTTSTNMYAALEHIEMDRRPNSRDNKDPYSSKGPSMERNSYKSSYDGRGSRSGSQHRDTGTPMRNSGPPPAGSVMLPPPAAQPKPSYTPAQPAAPPPVPKPSEEQIQRRIHNSLDEYLTGCCTTNEYFEDIAATVPPSEFSKVVYESYNYILEKSQPARLKTGELFAKLLRNGDLSLDHFITGFQELLSLWEDLVIDIPQILHYFAEDLVHLCLEEVLPIDRLHQLLECLISNNVGQKLLKPLFGLIVKEKGPNFLQIYWHNSGMQLTNFMSSSEVESFIKENNFEFLVGGKSPVGQTPLSYEEIQRKLSEFFKSKTPFDDIGNWISANIGDRVKENKFIRTLATAIFEDSISKNKLVPEVLISHTKLIQKYVDNNTDYELQCLYALQSLAHKLEHPQGLLLSICDKLYEDSTFCQESFIAWENSTDPAEQEGKGVALKQLTSFFTQLKENEEDEDYSSNSEDA